MKMQFEIARDKADVQSLLSTLQGWVNPFQCQGQDPICLSTGKAATEDVLTSQRSGRKSLPNVQRGKAGG